MADTTLVNIRMDSELKKNMEATCRELGMNMTTAFTIYAKKVTRERRIPFEVSADPFYSENNKQVLNESIHQIEQGRVVVKTMEDLEALANE